jgi:hypothetical protein
VAVAIRRPGPPPQDALDFFRAKGWRVGFDYRDVWRDEHASAFTVAKAMQLDVLRDIRAAVDEALEEGLTFAQFREQLQPQLVARGWWGVREITDPLTGERRPFQLGSPRRLRTIYRANLRTARAAGQWARIERSRRTHPYLVYELGPSENHREEHVAWSGLILPVDHPFWRSHMPPNGWGCKCRVRQITRRERDRLVGTGRYSEQAPATPTRQWVNKRTGEVERLPVGIDPGWDTNPGLISRQARALGHATEKLDAAPAALAAAGLRDLVRGGGFARWYQAPDGNFPLARLPEADAKAIGSQRQVAMLSAETARKQRQRHPELAADEYVHVQGTVERGRRVQDGERELIYIWEAEPRGYVSVVKATQTGRGLFVSSFRRLSSDQVKRDEEVRRLLRKGEE